MVEGRVVVYVLPTINLKESAQTSFELSRTQRSEGVLRWNHPTPPHPSVLKLHPLIKPESLIVTNLESHGVDGPLYHTICQNQNRPTRDWMEILNE